MKSLLDWRKALLLTHRWMGMAGGLLVLMWFVSGIVMMYHRMPEVGAAERLERLEWIDASAVRIAPAEAAARAGAGESPSDVRMSMLGGRPVYRFGTGTVYADTGAPLEGLSADQAVALAAAFAPDAARAPSYDALLSGPDQWTLQNRADLPLHRVALGDGADTHVYVSDRSGEVVMRTTRSGRTWGYAGAVLHWLYFTPFRAHSTLWSQTIIWLSIAGCLLTLSGLLWGIVRISPFRRHRIKGERSPSMTPYTGLLAWHHYAGLLFGLFTFTWMLSGGLSMDPWNWHPGTGPTIAQSEAFSLGPPTLAGISAERVRDGATALSAAGPLKEVRLVRFRGRPYLLGRGESPSGDPHIVSALTPGDGTFDRFPAADLIDAAAEAMPGVGIRELVTLDGYDSYYYDHTGSAPLPVLRIAYADPQGTTLYIDPGQGLVVRKEERLTRWNRWLYRGLHSLDFPFLYARRPLWDALVVLLSLGGMTLAATTLWPSWQRLARHIRRIAGG